jgi:hypothetical protein
MAAHYNSHVIHPLEYAYNCLQVKLLPLDRNHQEYCLIKRFMDDG